jgi:hypothetical protein
LREHFKNRGAKLNEKNNLSDINENLNNLIQNIDSVLNLNQSSTANNEQELEQLENALNSLISLIIISPDENSKLVATFCESLLKAQLTNTTQNNQFAQHRYGLIKLRILSNLFHGLISTSKHRYTVFVYLSRCSLQERNLQFMHTNLDLVKKYLQTWQSSVEETQTLYRLLFEALSQMNEANDALKFVNELLSTYTKENASKAREDANKYAKYF